MNNSGSDPFASYVRNWIHQNDLASTFLKQSLKARQIRDEYETKIIDHLTQNHMENAIIQISDGRLSVVEERVPRSLTMKPDESNDFLTKHLTSAPAGSPGQDPETISQIVDLKARRMGENSPLQAVSEKSKESELVAFTRLPHKFC